MSPTKNVLLNVRQPAPVDLDKPVAFDPSRESVALTSPASPTRRRRVGLSNPDLRHIANLLNGAPHKSALPAKLRVRAPRPSPVPVLPKRKRFPVASIDFSRPDVALPFGTPDVVNAMTLKRLANAEPSDRLMRKTPEGWKFVPDDTLINLKDGSKKFRVGRLTIFS